MTAADSGRRGSAERHRVRLLDWLREAAAEGWVPEEEIRSLQSLETRGAERLFEPAPGGRPLTVGLFGGTGVGKSSLLNRLVGESVARVGLERPTSTEVTLYVHEQFPLRDLGEELPVERVNVLTHGRDEYRDVVWIDMPDIDSVETDNRELVFEWLPLIDWLVYVVSPEKYRDDAGWRILERRGHRHHWMFVINRWDTGTAAQYDDFRRLLDEAGMAGAPLLRTSCVEALDDDFSALTGIVDAAVAEHGLARLQRVGEQARLADLVRECDRYAAMLGDPAQWRSFMDAGRSAVGERLAALDRCLVEEAALQAADLGERRSETPVLEPVLPGLVDDHIRDLHAAIRVAAGERPVAPVEVRTQPIVASVKQRAAAVMRDAFRQGVSRPGNAVQRAAVAAMRKLVWGLPLLAGAGIAYVVVTRYAEGLRSAGGFLGLEFLLHSMMVLGLAALLPYLLARLLRPSVRRSVIRRTRAGLAALHTALLEEWDEAMEALAARHRTLTGELEAIRDAIEAGRE